MFGKGAHVCIGTAIPTTRLLSGTANVADVIQVPLGLFEVSAQQFGKIPDVGSGL